VLAKLNDARYHGVNFHPVHGHDPTTFEAWSGPNIGRPDHRPNFGNKEISNRCFAMSPDILVIAFHFSPLNFNQTYFSGRMVDSPCTLFHFAYLLRCVSWSQKTAVTSCSLLASSTNLHSLQTGQTGYWSPVTITVLSAHRQGIISATRLIVASCVCILPHDVCQPKHKQTQ